MAEDTNQSVAYLKALKHFAGPAGATTAAREDGLEIQEPNDAVANSTEQLPGAEKRRSPRYKCEGRAELRKDGSDVRTWATFTDISLHGCYVEAQANYPVGTILHMKLEANGFHVESCGNVRVNYPYLGMGIAFTEMLEINQKHLKGLLSTISRRTVVMGSGIASSRKSSAPSNEAALVADPAAALRALTEFFDSRQMLMRDDFFRILRKSQNPPTLP